MKGRDGLAALAQLVQILGGGAIDEKESLRQKAMQEHIDKYVKSVIETSSNVMDEVFECLKTNPCGHAAHRMVPTGRDDYTAVFNVLAWIINLHLSATGKCIHSAYEIGKAVAESEPLPSHQNMEALYEVSSALLLHTVELLQDTKLSMLDFHGKLESEVRKHIAEANEVRLTGKQAEEKPSHAHCH
jgi:hypothetical protein